MMVYTDGHVSSSLAFLYFSSLFSSPSDHNPWVQVDFLEPKLLSGVMLQGQWPVTFHVQHSMDGIHFEDYIDTPESMPRVFTAYGYGREPTTQVFNRNIIAQYIRIVPIDINENMELK